MSRDFQTADLANYLLYDAGSATGFSFPFTVAVFAKVPTTTASHNLANFSGSTASRYTALNQTYTSTARRYSYTQRSETERGYETSSGINPPVDAWYANVLVCESNVSRKWYYGLSNSNLITHTDDSGSLLDIRYVSVGVIYRAGPTISLAGLGKIARVARWDGVALSASEVQSYMDGTAPTSIQSANLWGYWPLDGSNLNDASGNARHLTEVGTVPTSTDEPFEAGTQYIPTTSPLYYGANLLANKTNIQWSLTAGISDLGGDILSSGTNGTTNASGVFQHPAGAYGALNDPVTLSLYWEEGNPAVDRSLIVKTTLAAA
jgi:hypothetical protein